MCGIAGKLYFKKEKKVTEHEIKTMSDSIAHRGPDGMGIFLDGNLGLGHRRLAIIDLSERGKQPMTESSGRFTIVFNGEIYNYRELKKELEAHGYSFTSGTDTEVILLAFAQYGKGCLIKLRGMFSFAIWDREKRELFVARDRVGKKPLKYYLDSSCFIFASELKAILKNKEIKKEIDYPAIDEYLTYKYVPCPKTGFKYIYKLPPAHFAIAREDGTFKLTKYWDLEYEPKPDLSEQEWEKMLIDKLKESVGIRMEADVPLGTHLSGGIDSSLITAFMAERSFTPVKTFSIGFEDAGYNELPYAKLVAQRYKTDHNELFVKPDAISILEKIIFHYEEPYADASALPSWYLSEVTKKHISVALNGDGGDENFGGYDRYTAMKLHSVLKHLPFKEMLSSLAGKSYKISRQRLFERAWKLLRSHKGSYLGFYLSIISYFSPEDKSKLYNRDLKEKTDGSNWEDFSKSYFKASGQLDWLDQLLYVGMHTHLPDDLLVKVDIASMAHGLETRSPFLDHELLEFSAKMPSFLR